AADFHDVYSVTVTVSDTSGRSTVSPQVQFVVSGCGEAPPVILTSAQQAISGAIVRRPGSDSTEQLDITTTLGAADSTPTFVLDGVHYDLPFYLDAPVAEAVQLDSYAGS